MIVTRLSDMVREQHQSRSFPGKSNFTFPPTFHTHGQEATPQVEAASAPNTIDWYRLAEESMTCVGDAIRQHTAPPLEEITEVAAGLAHSIQQSDDLLYKMLTARDGRPLVTNSVNVAIVATKIGLGLGHETPDIERLALAGLLHDLGMFRLPESLLMKSEGLLPGERALIEQHPLHGSHLVRALGSKHEWLATVILQEHERWDGQGYPNKLKGSQIQGYAQIIGLADVFDALVSVRPYHRPVSPHEALRELLINGKQKYSHALLKALVEQLSMYPLGTTVRLNTGEVGVVTRLNRRHPLKPVLEISQSVETGTSPVAKIVDLSATFLAHIVEVIKPQETRSER